MTRIIGRIFCRNCWFGKQRYISPSSLLVISTRPFQAKLKNCHEVVVRNRLQQLRKRQRDEALQAQEELLAGVATAASKRSIGSGVPTDGRDVEERAEEAEPYHRSMSPRPIDINRLRGEERDAEIISAAEDRQIIVCGPVFIFFDIDTELTSF